MWVRGGSDENLTIPLLQPAASGKVSIRAQVLGVNLQLSAFFLPFLKRSKCGEPDSCFVEKVADFSSKIA